MSVNKQGRACMSPEVWEDGHPRGGIPAWGVIHISSCWCVFIKLIDKFPAPKSYPIVFYGKNCGVFSLLCSHAPGICPTHCPDVHDPSSFSQLSGAGWQCQHLGVSGTPLSLEQQRKKKAKQGAQTGQKYSQHCPRAAGGGDLFLMKEEPNP